jgi:hypothetical protein
MKSWLLVMVLSTSMVLGGISPTGMMGWRIQHVGDGGTSIGRVDFTGVGCVPGSSLCIAHGLHRKAFQSANYGGTVTYPFVGDIDAFDHCCDPETGVCGSCP